MIYLFLAVQVVFFTGCVTGHVPIGGVVDWYRPNASFPTPDGYMIADGSIVTDSESPLLNETLPDLRAKFVRGAATISEVGTVGGAVTHSHGITLSNIETDLQAELPHWHNWAHYDADTKRWTTYKSHGVEYRVLVDWGNGIDDEGGGTYPLTFSESYLPGSGEFVLETSTQLARGAHRHIIESPNNINTGNTPIEPPYVVLIKIVRIK
jgi:hypothetical protein